ncbi:MAG: hypothetical protein IMW96_06595 [Thermoanaerobacteraceae bacterium]|nr:hypothetical protein [Thermoanaerobacteraceae bacterium]
MEHLLGFTTILLGTLIIVFCTYRYRSISLVLWAAFIIRVILALIHAYLFPLPDSQADALRFESIAWEMAQGGPGEIFSNFTTGAYFYSWIISILYVFTDRSPLMMQGVNVIFGTLIVLNVYRISLILWNEKIFARRAAWVAAFFPTLCLYSALTMREAFWVYFVTLGILFSLEWWRRGSIWLAVKATVSFVLSVAFHTGALPMLGILGMLVAYKAFVAMAKYRMVTFLRYGLIIILLTSICVAVIFSGWGMEKFGLIKEGLAHHQEVAARDRAAYLQDMTMNTVSDMFWQTPIRIVYFLFTPFPWWVRQSIDLMGLADALLYIWLAVCSWKLKWSIYRNTKAKIVALFLLVGLAVFAIATSNYGTALRHRAKFAPLLISLAAPAILRVKLYLSSNKGLKLCNRERSYFLPPVSPTAEPKHN